MKTHKETYELKVEGNHVKIYINSLIHIQFRCEEFIGLHSTIEGTNWFRIYVHLKNGMMQMEYGNWNRFISILKLIDQNKL